MRSIVSFTAVLGTASVLHGHSIFLQVSYHSSRLVHVQWIRNYNISTWGGASFIYTWRQQWPICVVVWRSCSTWLKFTSPVQSNCCQKLLLLLLLLSPLFQFLKNCHGGFSYVRLVAVWGKEVGENTFFKIQFLHENTHSFCQVKRRSVKLIAVIYVICWCPEIQQWISPANRYPHLIHPCHRAPLLANKLLQTHQWATLLHYVTCFSVTMVTGTVVDSI